MGIPQYLNRILNSYLNDRYGAIIINNTKGENFKLETGIPQGDIISATLFILMVNDYPPPNRNRNSNNHILQYADDTTQVIITKFNVNVRRKHKEIHNTNVKNEIIKQNLFENK